MPQYNTPEILLAPISKLVLQTKHVRPKIGLTLPSQFLSQAIDVPAHEQFEEALTELANLGVFVRQPDSRVLETADTTVFLCPWMWSLVG